MFTLKIKTDNAAFQAESGDDWATANEIARILRDTAKFLETECPQHGVLRDINGNRVGEFKLS